jgi:hypothetical protein
MLGKAYPHKVVQLVGGLGNQLFGYAFGLYLEKATGATVSFDTYSVSKNGHGGLAIQDAFELTGDFETELRFHKLIRFGYALPKLLSRLPSAASHLEAFYQASEPGFVPDLERTLRAHYVRGYFQSYRYLDHTNFEDQRSVELTVRGPSDWYLEERAKLQAVQPIAIHIRRGDYSNLSSSYGLLGPEYYQRGITALTDRIGARTIYIFSDEPDIALAIRAVLPKELEAELVIPPEGAKPSESLSLMSHAAGMVCANSSFSWWAAATGNSSKVVYAPDPWHRTLPTPRLLLPPTWISADPNWL